MRVDGVGGPGRAAEGAGSARASPVKSVFAEAAQQAGEQRLARASPPRLGHAPGRRHDPVPAPPGSFHQRGNAPVASLEADQSAGVKYQAHSGGSTIARGRRTLESALGLGDLRLGEVSVLLFPGRDGLT